MIENNNFDPHNFILLNYILLQLELNLFFIQNFIYIILLILIMFKILLLVAFSYCQEIDVNFGYSN